MALIDSLTKSTDRYYSAKLRLTLDNHLSYLISNSTIKTIDQRETIKYPNNLNGILALLGVKPKYWYACLITNGFKSSYEYDGRSTLLIPDSSYIDDIVKTLETTERELF